MMPFENHGFCRRLLTIVMEDVREHTTVEQRKAAWAYNYHDGNVEFHGPEDFYWYGSGCCNWHARAEGWQAWMREKGFEEEPSS